MASAGIPPASAVGKPSSNAMFVDKLPEEINEMKIKDDKVEKVAFSQILIAKREGFLCLVIFFSLLFHFSVDNSFVVGTGSNSGGWKWN